MTDLTVDGLADRVLEVLQQRARRNGITLEEEARNTLMRALDQAPADEEPASNAAS